MSDKRRASCPPGAGGGKARRNSSGFQQKAGYSVKRPNLETHADLKKRSSTPSATARKWTGTSANGQSKKRLSDSQRFDQRQKWLDSLQKKSQPDTTTTPAISDKGSSRKGQDIGVKPASYATTTGVSPPTPVVGPSPRLFRPNASRENSARNNTPATIQEPIVTKSDIGGFNVGKAELSNRSATSNTKAAAAATTPKRVKQPVVTVPKSPYHNNTQPIVLSRKSVDVIKKQPDQQDVEEQAEFSSNVEVSDILALKRHVGILIIRPSKDKSTLTCLLSRSVEWDGVRIPRMESTQGSSARQIAFRAATRYGGISTPGDCMCISRNVPPLVFYSSSNTENSNNNNTTEVVEVLVSFINIDDETVENVWPDCNDPHGTGGWFNLADASKSVQCQEERRVLLLAQSSLSFALQHGAIAV